MFWYNSEFCKSIDVFEAFESAVYQFAHWLTTTAQTNLFQLAKTANFANIADSFDNSTKQAAKMASKLVFGYNFDDHTLHDYSTERIREVVSKLLKHTSSYAAALISRATPTCWVWSDLAHGSIVLFLFCLSLCATLWICDKLAIRYWSRYAQLPSRNRQLYVLVNLSKAFCLAVLFFSHVWFTELYALFVLDQWSTVGWRRLARIKHTAALYVATDVVALYIVPRLPKTTVVHHYVAWLLALCIFATDVSQPQSQVIRMVMLYGAWSTVPYAVNAFLALRRLSDDPDDGQQVSTPPAAKTINVADEKKSNTLQNDVQVAKAYCTDQFTGRRRLNALAAFALVVYFITCTVNWAWHAYWIIGEIIRAFFEFVDAYDASLRRYFIDSPIEEWWPAMIVVLYSLSVALLARDDLILMQWLWTRAQEIPVIDFCVQSVSLARTALWDCLKFLSYRSLPERTTEVKQ